MSNLARLPRILRACRQAVRKVQASFDLLEQQDAAVGGRAPVVDDGGNRLCPNPRQAGQDKRIFRHGGWALAGLGLALTTKSSARSWARATPTAFVNNPG